MNTLNTPVTHSESQGSDRDQRHVSAASAFYGKRAMGSAVFAVVLFSLTAPMSQVALTAFTPEFIAFMRAGLAGVCSLMLAGHLGWSLPCKSHCITLLIAGFAVTLVFPYTLSVSLSQFDASDLGVILAGVPLITAFMASVLFKEKQNAIFWLCFIAGTVLLVIFSIAQSGQRLHLPNLWSIVLMLLSGSFGYTLGGQVAKSIGGFKTICWMTIFYLPVSLLGVGYESIHNGHALDVNNTESILALLYLCLISQWIGFHFWYGAMSKMGIATAGQVQLLQPFFTMLFSVPLLGSVLTFQQCIYAGLITCTVMISMKCRNT